MVAYSAAPFTALTASIKFNGIEVGELQDLSWQENNNVIPVNAIGSPIALTLVQGVRNYNLNARRAYLVADLLISLLEGIRIEDVRADFFRMYYRDPIPGSVPTTTIVNQVEGRGLSFTDKISTVFFDIDINLASKFEDNPDMAGTTSGIYTFTDCVIASRNQSLDTNSILSMENVTINAVRKIVQKRTNPILKNAMTSNL